MTLTSVVREAVRRLDQAGTETAGSIVAPVRAALAARGLGPCCNEGQGPFTAEQTVEWYAGQLLDIVDNQHWFAMNSIVNTVDKFAPEGGP